MPSSEKVGEREREPIFSLPFPIGRKESLPMYLNRREVSSRFHLDLGIEGVCRKRVRVIPPPNRRMKLQAGKFIGYFSHHFPAPIDITRFGLNEGDNLIGLRADERMHGGGAARSAVKRKLPVTAYRDNMFERNRERVRAAKQIYFFNGDCEIFTCQSRPAESVKVNSQGCVSVHSTIRQPEECRIVSKTVTEGADRRNALERVVGMFPEGVIEENSGALSESFAKCE